MHRRLLAGNRSGWWLLVLALAFGPPRISSAGEWKQVGLLHAEFARALGREGMRFGPEFSTWAGEFIDEDCEVRPTAARLSSIERRRVELLRTQYCKPWNQAWEICDAKQSPSWCRHPTTIVVEFEKYFDALAAAVKGARGTTHRYNLMVMVIAATGVHAITEFPADRVDQWVAQSAAEFLRDAPPADAIQIARLLRRTWVGLGPITAGHLKNYGTRRSMSAEA